MKKTFNAPSINFMEVETESAILGASSIVASGQAQSGGTGGVSGGNGGDANSRQGNPVKVTADVSAYELN